MEFIFSCSTHDTLTTRFIWIKIRFIYSSTLLSTHSYSGKSMLATNQTLRLQPLCLSVPVYYIHSCIDDGMAIVSVGDGVGL